MGRENAYQMRLIKTLYELFPGCIVLKNDANYLQGFPDLTILYKDKWAVLEAKASYNSPDRANQVYYIETLDQMSFAAFIHPENEEEVLSDLQVAFRTRRAARVSKR
jgi:hypothetical protein